MQGPEALQDHPVQPLSWQEVQGLAGQSTVGLPLGYKPTAAALPPPYSTAAAATAAQTLQLTPPGPQSDVPSAVEGKSAEPADGQVMQELMVAAVPDRVMQCQAGSSMLAAAGARSWRRPGWTRSQYVSEAVAAAAACRSHGASEY